MPDPISVLLDQNVPREIAGWLKKCRDGWNVYHASEIGYAGKTDNEVFDWAQGNKSIIITFDEDFADHRIFASRIHHGIIRLRVWPTTIEETENALSRLLAEITDEQLRGALVIIDRNRIRVRCAK